MSITTSLMGLTIPQVNDSSPGYASAIAASLALLDTHDHTSGKGAQVPSAGININAPLPFNGNSITGLRSAQLQALASDLSATVDNNSLFSVNGDLHFLDGSNRLVPLTVGGAITFSGGFAGDYTASNASAIYTHSTRQYTFLDELGVGATINCGGLILPGTDSVNFGGAPPASDSIGVSIMPLSTGPTSIMMSIQGDISALGGFVHSAYSLCQTIAASQTNATMKGLNGIAGGASNAVNYWVAPRQGSVVGLSWYYTVAQTAGNLTLAVYKNGSALDLGVFGATKLGPLTAGQVGSVVWPKDIYRFVANDLLEVRYTTDSAFAPVGHDGVVYLHVEY